MANDRLALSAHLLRRAGFGATRDELEAYAARPYEEVVDDLLVRPGSVRFELVTGGTESGSPQQVRGQSETIVRHAFLLLDFTVSREFGSEATADAAARLPSSVTARGRNCRQSQAGRRSLPGVGLARPAQIITFGPTARRSRSCAVRAIKGHIT